MYFYFIDIIGVFAGHFSIKLTVQLVSMAGIEKKKRTFLFEQSVR